jgi:hypothetical protein
MKRIAAVAFAVGLATAPAAFAEQTKPMKMSEAQLDQVTGGQLVNVSVNNVGNPTVTVNPSVTVNPNIQVSVLGGL